MKRARNKEACSCAWLTHPRTGARISIIRWCQKHKPTMQSMSGRPVENKR